MSYQAFEYLAIVPAGTGRDNLLFDVVFEHSLPEPIGLVQKIEGFETV